MFNVLTRSRRYPSSQVATSIKTATESYTSDLILGTIMMAALQCEPHTIARLPKRVCHHTTSSSATIVLHPYPVWRLRRHPQRSHRTTRYRKVIIEGLPVIC